MSCVLLKIRLKARDGNFLTIMKLITKSSFLTLLLMLGVLVHSHAQQTLTGTVRDQENQQPVEGVNVFIPELQKGTITDADGRFTLGGLPAGQLKVQFSHIGYQNIIRNMELKNDTSTPREVALKPTVIESEAVVVSAGNYSTQHDNAIKIELLKPRQLDRLSAPSLMGKLRKIPGVDMIGKGQGVTKPVIRGLSNSNILVLNNGVKLENFQFSENHPFMVDEFGTDRVEVIKGPASLLYGSDAVGGIINVLREKPAPTGTIEGDITQKYHTNTRGYVTNVGVKGTTGNFFWGVRGGRKSHADYISGSDRVVPNTRFLNQSFHAFTGVNPSFGSFKLYYDYYEKDLGMSVPGLDTLVNGQDRDNEMWYQDLDNHMVLSKNTFYLDPVKIDADFSLQSNHRQLVTMQQTPVDMRMNTWSADVKARYEFNGYSDLIVGVQAVRKDNDNGDAINRVLPDHQVRDVGVFGLLQYSASQKLKTQAGFRWDHRNINIPGQPRTGRENSERLAPLDRSYGDVSGSLGATYRLNSTMLLRANLSSGYRTPNVAELTQQGLHGNRFEEGNRTLGSQNNYEADLSFHYHCCHALLDVSGYYNHVNDYIYLAPAGESTPEGYEIYRYSQDDARLYGGEVRFEIRPVEWFDATATYSKTIGEQQDGANLPFIPQDKLQAGVRLESGPWAFFRTLYTGVETTYAFEQDRPSRFETSTDAYFLVDLTLGGEMEIAGRRLQLGISVDNLMDEAYIHHLSTLKPLQYRNMGRNIVFSLKIPFKI